MPPLILHNVPEEERFVGEDGIQRPYAMIFPGDANPRARRTVPETGSFGRSTRRSRSRTGTPAAVKREDPTLAAADAVFSKFIATRNASQAESPQRKSSAPSALTQGSNNSALTITDGNTGASSRYVHKEPTEVILRGFMENHQYAAIHQYEHIAGRICEDYSRDPPQEQRRYKADVRDPVTLRRQILTPEEKAKALKYAGGLHWIKVTFESAEAAEVATSSSPQPILGHLVYAELYRGVGPSMDAAMPATSSTRTSQGDVFTTTGASRTPRRSSSNRRPSSALPRSFTTPAMSQINHSVDSNSPPSSLTSSQTLDSATLSTATASTATVTGTIQHVTEEQEPSIYCRKIPTARRIQLLSAEQALLPQPSFSQRFLSNIPLLNYLSSDVIGKQLPRTESGDFDWQNASLYWKVVWYIDSWVGWFDVASKED
ncbi:Nucleoporin NUP53 [Phlyctema vagabunda]|uniref:Nucleoporin NUP53 n=1 Tax=Phlyctema vagabunda TaxID=108571 RepID=A0ABR4PQ73_9HELO